MRLPVWIGAGLLLPSIAGGAPAEKRMAVKETVVTVQAARGDGRDDTLAVRAALDACRKTGARRLIFPKGRYDFMAGTNPDAPDVSILLQRMENLTIDGQGSTLIFHGLTAGFRFVECRNIRVQNFVMEWEPSYQSVGTVVAAGERHFDVAVLDEFPVQGGEPVEAFMDFDPQTRLPRRRGVDAYYSVESTELLRPQVLRVHLKQPIPVPTGVLVALRHKVYGPAALHTHRCKDFALSNVTVYSVPGMGFVGGVTENITLDRFRVLLKPGTQRLVSATADGSHFGGCKGTIRITRCVFEGMGDDAVNIKSGLYLSVRRREDDHTVLAQHNLKMVDPPDPGDRMEALHTDTLLSFATLTVDSVEVLPQDGLHRVRFREPLPQELTEGDVLGNISRTPRVRISGCTVRRNRARGFLIQTRDAIIENNRFERVTGGGVWVMTEVVHFFESITTRNIIVRNNVFDECNYGAALGDGVLSVFAWLKDFRFPPKPGVHRDIVLEGNVIRGAENAGIFVAGVDGITLRNNTVTGACRAPTRPECSAAISIISSRRVVVEGNTALRDAQGPGCQDPFRLGSGCEEATTRVTGNRGF